LTDRRSVRDRLIVGERHLGADAGVAGAVGGVPAPCVRPSLGLLLCFGSGRALMQSKGLSASRSLETAKIANTFTRSRFNSDGCEVCP
jgi:hypothetical protein